MSVKSKNYPFFPAAPYTFAISDCSAFKVYSNTDLQNVKTAELRGTLVLLCDKIEVIGEETGFHSQIASFGLITIGFEYEIELFG